MNHIFYELGKQNAQNLRKNAYAMTAAQLADNEHCVPDWTPRDFTQWPINAPVQWNNRVYRLLQPYDGTVFQNPPDAPDMAAMWGICHTKNPEYAKPWCEQDGVRNVYHKDECYKAEDGSIYISKQDNLVYDVVALPDAWTKWEK